MQSHPKIQNEKGFTLIELIIVIAGMSIMMPMLFSFANMALDRLAEKTVGDHLARVSESVSEYVLANYSTLETAATAAVATTIPFATLIADGHLPTTFRSTNGWNQTYQIYVIEPTAGNLQAIVLTTGGRDQSISAEGFADRMVPLAAINAGAIGGYVPTGNLPGESNAQLMGAMGGWTFTFAGTNIPNPGSGHLGSMMYFDSSDVNANDYLHRVAVPGAPELNAMTVNLDMDGFTIEMGGDGEVGGGDTEGVGRINFEDLAEGAYACAGDDDTRGSLFFNDDQGLFICRQGELFRLNDTGNTGSFQGAGIVSHGSIVNQPTCPASLPTPQIFFAPAIFSDDNNFYPLQAVQAWATDNGNGTWTANLRVMASGAWMNPSSVYGRKLALVSCGL